jgi:hypothetical protein
MGIFRWQHRQTGRFFNWGKAAALPQLKKRRELASGRIIKPSHYLFFDLFYKAT